MKREAARRRMAERSCRVPRGSVSLSLLPVPPSSVPDSYSPLTSLLLRPSAQSRSVRRGVDCRLSRARPGLQMGSASASRPVKNVEEAADAAAYSPRSSLPRLLNLGFSCSPLSPLPLRIDRDWACGLWPREKALYKQGRLDCDSVDDRKTDRWNDGVTPVNRQRGAK